MSGKYRNRGRFHNQAQRLRTKLAVKQGPKKICLTMIVKNESKNMPRLLDSVKSIIDMVSIVDTGSTDDTEKVILKWGKENKIPTTVHHEPFLNFAHNRTHSVQMAKKTYKDADYFLLSDADFVWEIGDFDKTLLIDHKYLVRQYNKALDYDNIRLLSSKVDWECVCFTHEFWRECKHQTEFTGEVRTAKISTLAIDDREDGGCKADKFVRDERLLKQGLDDPKEEEFHTRYRFYLAQTLKDMQRFEESIVYYTKRVADKGWAEEVYYSKFQIGFNYEQLGWRLTHCVKLAEKEDKTDNEKEYVAKWNPNNLSKEELITKSGQHFTNASVNYLGAYNYRKVRAEALYHLTRMYRLLGRNEMAVKFALMGNQIKYPANDTLFIERACYTYLFDYELSITAFYVPEYKKLGREAIVRLLNRDDLPEDLAKSVENNSRHYL